MSTVKKVLPTLMVVSLLIFPMVVGAQLSAPDTGFTDAGLTLADIEDIIEDIANFIIVAAILIATIFIVWAGIKYATARGDSTKVSEATQTLKNGLIGAAIVLGIGVLLNTVKGVVSGAFFN